MSIRFSRATVLSVTRESSRRVKLRLDALDEVLNQLVPHSSAASHLIAVLDQSSDTRMPPIDDGRRALLPQEVEILATWIDEGVYWDESLLPTPQPATDHWAFQTIVRPAIPIVDAIHWVRTPVDAFIAQQHEELGVKPAHVASPDVLRRRICLDLTGLPPEVETFSERDRQLAADGLIEQLLASPAYGERWGRHWLDVARWAESNGHQHNRDRPYAWRYRDYVVRSFNENKPFDQFVREQIAGDELTPTTKDRLVGTGFLAAARYSGNELDKQIQRNDILVDVVNTTTNAFLGVTFECAQCHTHKFDPFTLRDYYRMQAFFTRGMPGNVVLERQSIAKPLIESRWSLFDSVHARLVKNKRKRGVPELVLVIPKSVVSGMSSSERDAFNELDSQIAEFPQAWAWHGAKENIVTAPFEMRWPLPRGREALANLKTYMKLRGDIAMLGPEVEPGWPARIWADSDSAGFASEGTCRLACVPSESVDCASFRQSHLAMALRNWNRGDVQRLWIARCDTDASCIA